MVLLNPWYATHHIKNNMSSLKVLFVWKKNNQDQKLNSFLPTRFVAGIHGQM